MTNSVLCAKCHSNYHQEYIKLRNRYGEIMSDESLKSAEQGIESCFGSNKATITPYFSLYYFANAAFAKRYSRSFLTKWIETGVSETSLKTLAILSLLTTYSRVSCFPWQQFALLCSDARVKREIKPEEILGVLVGGVGIHFGHRSLASTMLDLLVEHNPGGMHLDRASICDVMLDAFKNSADMFIIGGIQECLYPVFLSNTMRVDNSLTRFAQDALNSAMN